jgi:hypothetical protein
MRTWLRAKCWRTEGTAQPLPTRYGDADVEGLFEDAGGKSCIGEVDESS